MRPFSQFIAESMDASHKRAEKHFNSLVSAAGAIGAHSGKARVVYRHKGGQLSRTMVHDHNTGYTNQKGHHFGMHYSSRPGHNSYTTVHFKGSVPSSYNDVVAEIDKQNPHNKGTGHSSSLAYDIMTHYHKKTGKDVYK